MFNVFKQYGRIIALNGITLKVGKGVTGLIGPNGAGKTTTIKIAIGLTKPDSGRVELFGFNPWNCDWRIRRQVGVLFENNVLPSHFIVKDFLKYVAKFKELKNIEESIDEILKLVGLNRYSHRRIGELSAGLKQRLGLAQALIGYPELVILDEPLVYLDPGGRSELLNLIERLAKDEDISFLISSHILSELERICDKVFLIFNGSIIVEGTVNELMKKYVITDYVIEVIELDRWVKCLKNMEVIDEIEVDESKNRIYVKVNNFKSFQKEFYKLALKNNLYVVSLRPRYGFLEEIYRRKLGEKNE